MWTRNVLMGLAVLVLAAFPLFLYSGGRAEFPGADTEARDAVTDLHPGYKPWVAPLWEPPSGEIESLIFALQAALGAGALGFYFGRRVPSRKTSDS